MRKLLHLFNYFSFQLENTWNHKTINCINYCLGVLTTFHPRWCCLSKGNSLSLLKGTLLTSWYSCRPFSQNFYIYTWKTRYSLSHNVAGCESWTLTSCPKWNLHLLGLAVIFSLKKKYHNFVGSKLQPSILFRNLSLFSKDEYFCKGKSRDHMLLCLPLT